MWRGELLNIGQIELDHYRGKFIILNFWASWCIPCIKEMPDLEKIYQKYADQGLVVLAVGMGETQKRSSQFIKKYHLTFPILLDPQGTISKTYGVQALPATFFIGKDQTIFSRAIGIRDWNSPKLNQFYQYYLKQK